MYRRITTYIYSYDNGQKICSCGYCRFDVYDNQCKIFINVKVPDRYTMGIAEIYLLTQDEITKTITKEMLGKTGGLNGSICYRQICNRQICNRQHMAGDIGMDNIKGVLIYNGESLKKVFYCNLKGEEPNILSLEEPDKDVTPYGNNNEAEYFNDDTYEYNTNEYINREKADSSNIADSDDMADSNNMADGDNMAGSNNMADSDNVTDNGDATDSNDCERKNNIESTHTFNDADTNNVIKEKQIEYSDIVDWEHNGTEEENKNKKNNEKDKVQEDKWQELLFSKFPKVRISFGGEESEAIKMRPHDLVWFPRKYWRFSNNRCLLNGYYNYRYIMLVKGIGDREGNYYLAVPGKNMVNEAISAKKQGFSEFVRSKGDLGFWCCKVGQ